MKPCLSEKIFPYLHGFAFRAFPYSGASCGAKDGAFGVTFSENVAPNGENVGFREKSAPGAEKVSRLAAILGT